MNDVNMQPTADAAAVIPVPQAAHGPGAMLRQAREAVGLHVATLAVAMKVPVKRIEELEREDWNALPGPVFARGLASSICRHLKIDPQPILQGMPQAESRLNMQGGGFQQPLSQNVQTSKALSSGGNNGWIKWVVGALVLGTVLLSSWPWLQTQFPALTRLQSASNKSPATGTVTSTITTAPAEEPTPVASVQQVPSEAASNVTSSASVANGSTAPLAAPTAQPASAVGMVVPATAPAVPTANAGSAPGEATLTIQTPVQSWVTVRDANRKVVFEKAVPAGESAQINGAGPLSVVIGRGDVAQVTVKGQAFDLKPHTKGSVARFQVD